jgi:hypothetical protein
VSGKSGIAAPSRSKIGYELSKAVLSSAVSVGTIIEAGAALETASGVALGVVAFGALAAGLALGVGIPAIIVFAMAEFSAPPEASSLITAGESLSWLGSPSGLVVAVGAEIAGESWEQIEKAGKTSALLEAITLWNPDNIGETVDVFVDVSEYAWEVLRRENESVRPGPGSATRGNTPPGVERGRPGGNPWPDFEPAGGPRSSEPESQPIWIGAGGPPFAQAPDPSEPVKIGRPDGQGSLGDSPDGHEDEGGHEVDNGGHEVDIGGPD